MDPTTQKSMACQFHTSDGMTQVNGNCGATVAQALLPYPQYCSRLTGLNEGHGNSIYESLQGKVERHMRNGLYGLLSFTYANLYTNASENTQSTNATGGNSASVSPYNLQRQRAIAADNVPFSMTVAAVYDLPFGNKQKYLNGGGFTNYIVGGWQLSPIWSYNYGIPFAFGSSNCNVVPQFREGCIPATRSGASVLPHGRNGFDPAKNSLYINPAAFETDFTQFGYTGTGPVVTTIYGPSYQDFDLSITQEHCDYGKGQLPVPYQLLQRVQQSLLHQRPGRKLWRRHVCLQYEYWLC